jgi:hypothetical protein
MKHLRIFNTDTEYWNFINGSGKTLPHVSLCDDNYKVYFNPKKKLDNYIQLSIVNTYAPDGVGANAPKIIATSDYPVGRDIVISGTCTAEDVFPTQETTNFSITILQGEDSGVDEIRWSEVSSLVEPYYIISINSYECNVKSDSTYKYHVILS